MSRIPIRPAMRLQIAASQGYCCSTCQQTLGATFHIDHIQALCHGGSNDIGNLCALCPNCHAVKTSVDMQQYWDCRKEGTISREMLEKKIEETKCLEMEMQQVNEHYLELYNRFLKNQEEIEKLRLCVVDAKAAAIMRPPKPLNIEKTAEKYRSRLSAMSQEKFLEFAGAFMTDFRTRGVGDDATVFPRELQVIILNEEIQKKGFLPLGFVSANKKAGRYLEPLPGGYYRPDDEAATGSLGNPECFRRVVYIGGRNHFTGQEKSCWAVEKSDYVYQ